MTNTSTIIRKQKNKLWLIIIPLLLGAIIFSAIHAISFRRSAKAADTTTPTIMKYKPIASIATIDGNASEAFWANQATLNIDGKSVGSVTGIQDLSASLKATWDVNNLYIYTMIMDDQPNIGSSSESNHDGIDIYVDSDGSRGSGYSAGDCQYRVNRDQSQIFAEAGNCSINGIQAAQTNMAGGYNLEVKIPWQTLGRATAPAKDSKIGMDILVKDGENTQSGKYIKYSSGTTPWSNPNDFGLFTLEKVGVCGVSSSASATTSTPACTLGTIPTVATGNSQLSTLVSALQAADLVSTLSGPGPFTVFAPTNAAFDALPAGVLAKLLLPANKPILEKILKYHVASGNVSAGTLTGLINATSTNPKSYNIATLEGDTAQATIQGTDVYVDTAKVIITDVGACNGVVHVIDKVIIPNDVDLTPLLPVTSTSSTTTSTTSTTTTAPSTSAVTSTISESFTSATSSNTTLDAINDVFVVPNNGNGTSIDILANDISSCGTKTILNINGVPLTNGVGNVVVNNSLYITVVAGSLYSSLVVYPINGFSGSQNFTYTLGGCNGKVDTALINVNVPRPSSTTSNGMTTSMVPSSSTMTTSNGANIMYTTGTIPQSGETYTLGNSVTCANNLVTMVNDTPINVGQTINTRSFAVKLINNTQVQITPNAGVYSDSVKLTVTGCSSTLIHDKQFTVIPTSASVTSTTTTSGVTTSAVPSSSIATTSNGMTTSMQVTSTSGTISYEYDSALRKLKALLKRLTRLVTKLNEQISIFLESLKYSDGTVAANKPVRLVVTTPSGRRVVVRTNTDSNGNINIKYTPSARLANNSQFNLDVVVNAAINNDSGFTVETGDINDLSDIGNYSAVAEVLDGATYLATNSIDWTIVSDNSVLAASNDTLNVNLNNNGAYLDIYNNDYSSCGTKNLVSIDGVPLTNNAVVSGQLYIATVNNGLIVYPLYNFVGTQSFVYTISGCGATSTATVTVNSYNGRSNSVSTTTATSMVTTTALNTTTTTTTATNTTTMSQNVSTQQNSMTSSVISSKPSTSSVLNSSLNNSTTSSDPAIKKTLEVEYNPYYLGLRLTAPLDRKSGEVINVGNEVSLTLDSLKYTDKTIGANKEVNINIYSDTGKNVIIKTKTDENGSVVIKYSTKNDGQLLINNNQPYEFITGSFSDLISLGNYTATVDSYDEIYLRKYKTNEVSWIIRQASVSSVSTIPSTTVTNVTTSGRAVSTTSAVAISSISSSQSSTSLASNLARTGGVALLSFGALVSLAYLVYTYNKANKRNQL